jgi:hypothetical protein
MRNSRDGVWNDMRWAHTAGAICNVHAAPTVLPEPLITLEREIDIGMMAREDDPGTGLQRLFPRAGLQLTSHSRTPYLPCDCSAAHKGETGNRHSYASVTT